MRRHFAALLAAALPVTLPAQNPTPEPAPRQFGTPLRGHADDVMAVDFSRDGKLALSGGFTSGIQLFDATTGKRTLEIATEKGLSDARFCGPASERIACILHHAGLEFFDARTGAKVGKLEFESHFFGVSPDGKRIAVDTKDGELWFVDPMTATKTSSLKVGEKALDTVTWMPDGALVLVSDLFSRTGRLVDPSKNAVVGELKWPKLSMRQQFFADGKSVLVLASKCAIRMAVPSGEVIATYDLPETPATARIAKNGRDVWFAVAEGTLVHYDLEKQESVCVSKEHRESITQIALTPDESTLLTGSRDDTIRFWNPADCSLKHLAAEHNGPITAIAYAADGTLVSGCYDNSAVHWTKDGAVAGKHTAHSYYVSAVAGAPDGTFWTTSGDRTVRHLDAAGKELQKVEFGEDEAPATAIAVCKNGTLLVTGHADGSVRWIDVATQKTERRGEAHEERVLHVVASEDGAFVASAGVDGALVVWEPSRGEPVTKVDAHEGGVSGLVRLADGAMLTSGWNRELKRWNAKGTEATHSIVVSEEETAAIGGLAVLGKAGHVVCASADRLRVYAVSDLKPIAEWKTPPHVPTCAAGSPSGTAIAIGLQNGTIAVYDLDAKAAPATNPAGKPDAKKPDSKKPDPKKPDPKKPEPKKPEPKKPGGKQAGKAPQ